MKLRATPVGLIAVKPPAAQPARRVQGGLLELLQLGSQLLPAGQLIQIVPHSLVQALAHRLGRAARQLDDAVVNRHSDVHLNSMGWVRTVWV